jgi:6-phosphogluconolactonase
VSALPPDTKLVPGAPRGAVGTPGANQAPRNTDNDIWASDLHLTPNGRFLYAAERTSSTLAAFRVDTASGKLTSRARLNPRRVSGRRHDPPPPTRLAST